MAKSMNLIDKFYESRFLQSVDIDGNDLCSPALDKLKEHLQPEEFYFFKNIDYHTRKLITLLSEEEPREGTPEDENFLNSYETLADDNRIPNKYRQKMYGLLLIGNEKYVQNNTRYIEILNKSISLANRKSSELQRAYMLAKLHQAGANNSALLQTYQILRRKRIDVSDFPRLEEIRTLEQQQIKQNKQMSVEISRQQIKQKLSLGSSDELSAQERIKLYHESLNLLKKCGLRPSRTLRGKSYIYGKIKDIYNGLGDEEAVEFFAEKERCAFIASQNTIRIGLRRRQEQQIR